MKQNLVLRNKQKARSVDLKGLRRHLQTVLQDEIRPGAFEVALHLVSDREMTRLNESFLGHEGSTDVITFDYLDRPAREGLEPDAIYGEIFVCIPEAIRQARIFKTTWREELLRYCIHGLLHLSGFTDDQAPVRTRMKRQENRILRSALKKAGKRSVSTRK